MPNFGWDYPPGVSSLPEDEDGQSGFEYLDVGIWYNALANIPIPSIEDLIEHTLEIEENENEKEFVGEMLKLLEGILKESGA